MAQQATAPNYLPKVREQYEALPYPPCDAEDEYKRLSVTLFDRLDYLNHRFYRGRANFKGFRALSAGDGTGDASVFMAEQLSEFGGEVVSLDMSSASQAIAKRRAEIRGLTNITYLNESLLDIPKLNLGEFDFISCSGVLHHLADPDEGLRTLIGALKPGGILGVMVYAQTGRTGIYHMQALLNELLDKKNDPIDEQINLARTIIDHLPESNWLWHMHNYTMHDILHFGDSGIFDLLLHTQDRAYTIPQTYEWVKNCGGTFAEFVFGENHQEVLLNPAIHITDPEFVAQAKTIPIPDQQHVADLLFGLNSKQTFYVTNGPVPEELTIEDTSLIPSISMVSAIAPSTAKDTANVMRNTKEEKATFAFPNYPIHVTFTLHETTADLLEAIDGKRSIDEIVDRVKQQHPTLSRDEVMQQFHKFYDECRLQLVLVLRHEDGAKIPDVSTLQMRGLKRGKA